MKLCRETLAFVERRFRENVALCVHNLDVPIEAAGHWRMAADAVKEMADKFAERP